MILLAGNCLPGNDREGGITMREGVDEEIPDRERQNIFMV
jgi:hypothetical protein